MNDTDELGLATSVSDEIRSRVRDMCEKAKEDSGAPFELCVLEDLVYIKQHDPAGWERVRTRLQKAKIRMRALDNAVDEIVVSADAAEKNDALTHTVDPKIVNAAWELLETGTLLDSIVTATAANMKGGGDFRRLVTISGNTAFVEGTKLSLSTVGGAMSGKTAQSDEVMRHFPPENVINLAEVSPKAFYYMSKHMDFSKKIVRINDARESHIPVIKVLEDDSPIPATNYTVHDGVGVELTIRGKPVLWTTSVGPLTDKDGQTVSRSLMITPGKMGEEGDRTVKRAIWENEQFGDMLDNEGEEQRQIHKEAFRILRDREGTVLIPFLADPPKSCSRRGVRQFAAMIKSLAFINQYKRTRIVAGGNRYILANYDDFAEAARLWYMFADLQTHKSGGKTVTDVIVCLLTEAPNVDLGRDDPLCRTPKEIAALSGLPVRTVNDHLTDLYEIGYADRARMKAPGSPHAYWISAKYAKDFLLRKTASSDHQIHLGELSELTVLPKYVGKNSSDLLKDSATSFFTTLYTTYTTIEEEINARTKEVIEISAQMLILSYSENFTEILPKC